MDKHLKEYNVDGYFSVSKVENAWINVLTSGAKAVKMDDEEFSYFLRNFFDKLPYNWDREYFMGIQIIRVKAINNI